MSNSFQMSDLRRRLEMDQVSASEVVVRFDVYQDLGGLNELTLAQRQVLGAKHDWRQQELTSEEKLERWKEDLERRYHGGGDLVQASRTSSCTAYPKHTAFLNQWTYSLRKNPTNPILFRPDLTLPNMDQKQYHEIQFFPQNTGIED